MIEEYNTNVTIMTVVADSMLDGVIERILTILKGIKEKFFYMMLMR
jgi:hypothetical protein